MKKLLCLLLPLFIFACSSDSDDLNVTSDLITGKWMVTWVTNDGKPIEVPSGAIYMDIGKDNTYEVKYLDNTYIGTYKIKGSTIIGTTLDPITEYYKFTKLENNEANVSYSNSEGDKFKFTAVKK